MVPLDPNAPASAGVLLVLRCRVHLTLRQSHSGGPTLNAAASSVGFSTTETQYAATYLLVFISDIVTWTENQFGNWFDYMATP